MSGFVVCPRCRYPHPQPRLRDADWFPWVLLGGVALFCLACGTAGGLITVALT